MRGIDAFEIVSLPSEGRLWIEIPGFTLAVTPEGKLEVYLFFERVLIGTWQGVEQGSIIVYTDACIFYVGEDKVLRTIIDLRPT